MKVIHKNGSNGEHICGDMNRGPINGRDCCDLFWQNVNCSDCLKKRKDRKERTK